MIRMEESREKKTPTECRVRAVFLNLETQVGTP